MPSIFPGARRLAVFARISSIGSRATRHAKKGRKLRQFKPLFVLARGPFSPPEELTPLGLASGMQITLSRSEVQNEDGAGNMMLRRIEPISKSRQRPLIN